MPGADHLATLRPAYTPEHKCSGPPVQACHADSGQQPAACLCHMISPLLSILSWPGRPPKLALAHLWSPASLPLSLRLTMLISAFSVQGRPTTPASLPPELPRPKTRLQSQENILDSWWIDDPSLTSLHFRGFVPGGLLSLG